MGEMSSRNNLRPRGNLVFGVGAIHRLPFQTQRIRLVRQALDLGFRRFDVAPAYGNGLNEIELANSLVGFRSECMIATKFGIPSDLYGARHPRLFLLQRGLRRLRAKEYGEEYKRRIFNGQEMTRSLEGSLKRLKRDYVDDLLLHEPLEPLGEAELQDIHEQADRLKEQGKILRWGAAGPVNSIIQFRADPFIDVFQFPLSDFAKVVVSPLRKKVAYGVYQSYQRNIADKRTTFAEFVKSRLDIDRIDIIIASTSPKTLAGFQDCFR